MAEEEPLKFKVYYSNQIRKKHKVFEDGVLELGKMKVKLSDMDGNLVCTTFRPKTLKNDWEEPFILGQYYSKRGNLK
jgi:hypothetical protein